MPHKNIPYTHELEMTILERIAEGESLGAICADPGMPDRTTVLDWIKHNRKFREIYEFTREGYADDIAMDVLAIVDDLNIDIADARLRIEVRRWQAARIAPSKYGPSRKTRRPR